MEVKFNSTHHEQETKYARPDVARTQCRKSRSRPEQLRICRHGIRIPWYPWKLPHQAHDMRRATVVWVDTDRHDLSAAYEPHNQVTHLVQTHDEELRCELGNKRSQDTSL